MVCRLTQLMSYALFWRQRSLHMQCSCYKKFKLRVTYMFVSFVAFASLLSLSLSSAHDGLDSNAVVDNGEAGRQKSDLQG